MNKYHVGCGMAGIYAGTVKPRHPEEWQEKDCVTNEAIEAVRDWMMLEMPKNARSHGYSWQSKDGAIVTLRVSVESDEDVQDGGGKDGGVHGV